MKLLIFSKYNDFCSNQFRLKIIKLNIYYKTFIKAIELNIMFPKLESIKTLQILETFFFFKAISNRKAYISHLKKKYKEIDIRIKLNILKKNLSFFFLLLFNFFLPAVIKKEALFKSNFVNNKILNVSVNSYSFYPFIPNVYFSWIKKYVIKLNFDNLDLSKNKLFLSYFKINKYLMK